MRKIFWVVLCVMLLSATVAQAEMKVAVFDVQTVANKSDALKEAQQLMKKTYEGEREQLEKPRVALEKQAEKLKAKSTEAEQNAFRKTQREYSDKANLYVRKVQAAEAKIREEMDVLMLQAGREYAQRKGYNIILDTRGVVFFDQAMDVTNDMVTEANRVWQEAKAKNIQGNKGQDSKPDSK